jgi:hypothetical protein
MCNPTGIWGMYSGLYAETAGNNSKENPKRDPVDAGGGIIYEVALKIYI